MPQDSLSIIYLSAYFLQLFFLLLTVNIFYQKSWKISDIEGDVIETFHTTEGLLTKCQYFPNKYECEDFDQFFIALPTPIIAARILMYLSITSQIIAAVILPLCFECVKIVDDFYTRAFLYRYASIFVLIGGLTVGIAVSWYADLVIFEYLHHSEAGNYKFLWGKALYYGWLDMSGLLFLSLVFWFLPVIEKKMNRVAEVDVDFGFEDVDAMMERYSSDKTEIEMTKRNLEDYI